MLVRIVDILCMREMDDSVGDLVLVTVLRDMVSGYETFESDFYVFESKYHDMLS